MAAAPPLANYPIMGCIDDRGRLFIGDAAGLNLNRKELEEKLPNRVVMLEDTNDDGVYDKSTVFADKMTFPQGACWLGNSLYVASPPGIWKLTDSNDDGVADQREMIVGGFDFTGNAADVHGPFLHPNGRLFWCHGRKGHKVVQKDGTLVHEGLASGVWSCLPDGSDVQWHSLGCMDNPVEVDFTPEGDIFGVVNLYYNQPRGDTLVHWLYGGAYERPDQIKALAGLPRTREHMPVVHNFGHVAVSGCTFYRSGALDPAWAGDMFVTYFNIQKLVRTKLVPAGSTFTATQHEFLKINDPNVHITDVIEDGDGSLLVLDTGGWFRIGCPSSLVEKPDLRGAIYRIRKQNAPRVVDQYGQKIAWGQLAPAQLAKLSTDPRWRVREKAARLARANRPSDDVQLVPQVEARDPRMRLRAYEAIARAKRIEPTQRRGLLKALGERLDPALEHATIFAAISTGCFSLADLRTAKNPILLRRLLVVIEQSTSEPSAQEALLAVAQKQVGATDPELARTAVAIVARHPRALELLAGTVKSWLAVSPVEPGVLDVVTAMVGANLAKLPAQDLVTLMLNHPAPRVRQAAWGMIAGQMGNTSNAAWLEPLMQSISQATSLRRDSATKTSAVTSAREVDLPVILGAISKLATNHFDETLRKIVGDSQRSQSIRLKAMAALSRPNQPLNQDAFELLLRLSEDQTSPTARIEASRLLARSRLSKPQIEALAPVFSRAGPVELGELLPLARKTDAATGRLLAENLARSPVFGAIEESVFRKEFSALPPAVYEDILRPAVRAAAEAQDLKKRNLEVLTAKAAQGRVKDGRKVFESSACAACHVAGDLGRALGPDLSHIGQIRQSRDLLESILLPNATIARDYETHVVETIDGQSQTGMIKSDTPDGLRLVDLAGQEKMVPHTQIVATSTLPTSLMPMGLELSLSEQQLLDLVAWLGSLK